MAGEASHVHLDYHEVFAREGQRAIRAPLEGTVRDARAVRVGIGGIGWVCPYLAPADRLRVWVEQDGSAAKVFARPGEPEAVFDARAIQPAHLDAEHRSEAELRRDRDLGEWLIAPALEQDQGARLGMLGRDGEIDAARHHRRAKRQRFAGQHTVARDLVVFHVDKYSALLRARIDALRRAERGPPHAAAGLLVLHASPLLRALEARHIADFLVHRQAVGHALDALY